MSGEELLSLLKEANYPHVGRMDGDALTWMLHLPGGGPLIRWICANVKPEQALSDAELDAFERLEAQGRVVHGEDLKQAVSRMNVFGAEQSLEEVEHQVNDLTSELEELKRQLSRGMGQRDQLTSHHSQLLAFEASLKPQMTKQLEGLDEVQRELAALDSSLQDSLDELDATSGHLLQALTAESEQGGATSMHIHMNTVQQRHTSGSGAPLGRPAKQQLLSQLDLRPYLEADLAFTSQLKDFFNKQFRKGIAELSASSQLNLLQDGSSSEPNSHGDAVSGDKTSHYSLLNIAHPEELLIKGETRENYIAYGRELSRLQMVYASSQRDLINAEMDMARLKAALEESTSHQIRSREYRNMTMRGLSTRLDEVKGKLSSVENELAMLESDTLPELLWELSQLQSVPIFEGDYTLKIARQEYFISKQNFVLRQLREQRARHLLLKSAFDKELAFHRHAFALLSSCSTELAKLQEAAQERVGLCRAIIPSFDQQAYQAKKSVTREDRFTMRLFQLASTCAATASDVDAILLKLRKWADAKREDSHAATGMGREAFVTVDAVEQECLNLTKTAETLAQALNAQGTTLDRASEQMVEHVKRLKSLLPPGNHCSLCPPKIVECIRKLETAMNEFTSALEGVINSKSAREQSMTSDVMAERALFHLFHNRPEQMMEMVQQKRARIKAYASNPMQ